MVNLLRRLLELVLVVAVLALVVGQLLGQPVLLGFVTTGSMAPALEPGDGFVAVPASVGGPIEPGDVVVFEAEVIQGGGLTTHRIVEETEQGYVTKGDANAFTDQDNGEPPVKRAQVVAKAYRMNGHVVAIPNVGSAVAGIKTVLKTVQRTLAGLFGTSLFLGTQGLAYLFFAAALLYYAWGERRNRQDRTRGHGERLTREDGVSPRLVVGALTFLLVVGTTLPVVFAAGTQQYGVVSAEFDSDRATVVPAGESESLNRSFANEGHLPVLVYLRPASDGITVQPERLRLDSGGVKNASITLQAPPETGHYRRFIAQHQYPAILPTPAINALYRVHPWAPIVVIDALIGIPFYLVGVTVIGSGRVRQRSRDRKLSALAYLRRAIRSLY